MAERKSAVLVGLTSFDSAVYGHEGRGGVAGAELDVDNMRSLLEPLGYELTVLKTQTATRGAILDALRAEVTGAAAGDTVLVYFAAHGKQVRDRDGDELDDRDETICAYDGQIIDDELNEIWTSCAPDVRLVMISDTCNSGTNFRSVRGGPALTPMQALDRDAEPNMRAQLIHLGGCRDGRVSVGFASGGAFTTAICRIWDQERFTGTFETLCKRAGERVPRSQTPQYNEYGPVSAAFRNGRAFTGEPVAVAPSVASGEVDPGTPRATADDDRALTRAEINRIKADIWSASGQTRDGASVIRAVAEGDSWFDYVIDLDLLDYLEDRHGLSIKKFAKAGGTIENMAFGTRYNSSYHPVESKLPAVLEAVRTHKPEVFLLSGGGNDLVNDRLSMLIDHHAAREPHASGLRAASVTDTIDVGFRLCYEHIVGRVWAIDPEIHVFVHGYGNAIPDGTGIGLFGLDFIGPWLLPAIAGKGYEDVAERRELVTELIARFNGMLASLAQRYERLHYVDFRPHARDEWWENELHLTRAGYRALARVMREHIRRVIGR